MSQNLEYDIVSSKRQPLLDRIAEIDAHATPALVELVTLAEERFELVQQAEALFTRLRDLDRTEAAAAPRVFNHAGQVDYSKPEGYVKGLADCIAARLHSDAPLDFEALNANWPNKRADDQKKRAEGWLDDGTGGLISPKEQYRRRLANVRKFRDPNKVKDPLDDEVLADMRKRWNWPRDIFTQE